MLYIKFISILYAIIILSGICIAQDPIGLIINNVPEEKREINTKVVINKSLITDQNIELIYNITTPKVDVFNFVLALDCSGSMGNIEREFTRSYAASKAIPEFLNHIQEKYPKKLFNISIVGWSDKIDFVYGNNYSNPFVNNDISKALFANVETMSKDLEDYSLFKRNLNNSKPIYYPDETSLTDCNVPIQSSLDVFNNTNKTNFYRTSRFIILITGPGEFKYSNSYLLEYASEAGIPIYVIAMNVYEESEPELYEYLKEIANDNDTQISFISATKEQLEPSLMVALEDTLKRAVSRPVAKNVVITDTLYDYFVPDLANISVNGKRDRIINVNSSNNQDNTTTIALELADKLMPDSSTFVSIPLAFEFFGLPISATRESKAIVIGSGTTHISSINYTWFNELPSSCDLPDGNIDIKSNAQAKRQVSSDNPPAERKPFFLSLLRSSNFFLMEPWCIYIQ